MAEELQALLDRINQDGVAKGEAEKARIVEAAKAEAGKVVAEAKERAAKTVAEARQEAELLVRKGEESLKQASRTVLLSLRAELSSRLVAVVKASVAAELSGERLAAAIEGAIKAYMASGGKPESLAVLVPKAEQAAVAEHLLAALGKQLREKVEISPAPALAGGFRLVFDGADVVYDFSDEALTEVLCGFVNPKLAELVKAK